MKRIFLFLFTLTFACTAFAQDITFKDFVSLYSKKDIKAINSWLSAREWVQNPETEASNYVENNEVHNSIRSYWLKSESIIIIDAKKDEILSIALAIPEEDYSIISRQFSTNGFSMNEITDSPIGVTMVALFQSPKYLLRVYSTDFLDDYFDYSYYILDLTEIGSVMDPYNGVFQEYDDNGNITTEYHLQNGEKEGECINYQYDANGDLIKKEVQQYTQGKLHGRSYVYLQTEYGLKEYSFATYEMGVLNGEVCDVSDSLVIFSEYKNGELDGPYHVFCDDMYEEGDTVCRDTTRLRKLTDGFYVNSKKNGVWTSYFEYPWEAGAIQSRGMFKDNLFEGTWKYYLPTQLEYTVSLPAGERHYTIQRGGIRQLTIPHGGELYKEEHYSYGKLDGTVTQYGKLEVIDTICPEDHSMICKQARYENFQETFTYKNGKIEGPYELRDSLQQTIVSGTYSNGKKDGNWMMVEKKNVEKNIVYHFINGKYINDQMDGLWRYSFASTYAPNNAMLYRTANYQNGKLEGEWTEYSGNRPLYKKQFSQDKMTNLMVYNNDETTVQYNITNRTHQDFHCTITTNDIINTTIKNYNLKLIENMDKPSGYTDFVKAVEKAIQDPQTWNGEYKLLDYFGTVCESGTYENGNKTGNWIYVDYDQQIQVVYSYTNDRLLTEMYYKLDGSLYSGEYVFENETIKEERSIKNGMRNGKTVTYDKSTNKVISKQVYKDGMFK